MEKTVGNRERIKEIEEKLVKTLYMHGHNSHTIKERLIYSQKLEELITKGKGQNQVVAWISCRNKINSGFSLYIIEKDWKIMVRKIAQAHWFHYTDNCNNGKHSFRIEKSLYHFIHYCNDLVGSLLGLVQI